MINMIYCNVRIIYTDILLCTISNGIVCNWLMCNCVYVEMSVVYIDMGGILLDMMYIYTYGKN